MRTKIATLLTANFSLIGETATYTPSGGTGVAVKIIPIMNDGRDEFSNVIVISKRFNCDLLKSAVNAPAVGDKITYDGSTYTVDAEPELRDKLGLIWAISTRAEA